ncbi:MAG: MATE family efflux transporter [Bacteroidota bacterium]
MQTFIDDLLIAIRGDESNFTEGSIRRAIFLLAVPMVLEMSMESLFAIVDTYFVNMISVEAAAAVTLTESVMFLVYSVAFGLAMATTAMVARRIGEKDEAGAEEAATQSLVIGVAMAVLIMLVGIFFSEDILRLMGGSEKLIEDGKGYTQVMLVGNLSIMFLFLNNAIFRGAGDASLAMRALILSNGLNIFLDPLFIFGLGPIEGMGVSGAAVATNTGRFIGVLFQFWVLIFGSKSIIRLTKDSVKIVWYVILRLLKVASGGMGQYLIGSASWLFLVAIVAESGDAAVNGYGIAIRVIIFTILPAWGMANAAATLVGQNLGAGQPERAEKSVWQASIYNMLFLLAVSVVFGLLAEPIIGIFTQNAEALGYGTLALRIICLGYIAYAFGMVTSQAFNGAGDTFTPTMINVVAFWIIQIPLAWTLAKFFEMGPLGVFIAVAASETVLAVIAVILFRQGKWKKVGI